MHILHLLVSVQQSTAKGDALKLVVCEECGAEYVYKMERSATGSASGVRFVDEANTRSRAAVNAQTALQKKLRDGIDVVPCPACGHIQRHMIPPSRRRRHRWMLAVGLVLTVAACAGGFLAAMLNSVEEGKWGAPPVPWTVMIAAIVAAVAAGLGLVLFRYILVRGYDPNREDEARRLQIGQERAALAHELEAWRQERPADG